MHQLDDITKETILPSMNFTQGVRAQVLEVCIRQALAGAPWRMICKPAMDSNHISNAEVERHVELRKQRNAGQPPHIPPEDEESFLRYLNKWRETTLALEPLDREKIRASIARLCRILGVADPPVIFCQSPFQLKLYPLLVKDEVRLREGLLERARKHPIAALCSASVEEAVRDNFWQNLFAQLDSAGPGLPFDELENRVSFSHDPGPVWRYVHENLEHQWFLVAVSLPDRLLRILGPQRQLMRVSFFTSGTLLDGSTTEARARTHEGSIADGFAEPSPDSFEQQSARVTLDRFEGSAAPEPWTPVNALTELSCAFARAYNGRDLLEHCPDSQWLELMEARVDFASCVPACAYRRGIFYICERPSMFHFNAAAQLHNESGPAVKFSDGLEVYAFNGIAVPRNIIEHPEAITVRRIIEVQNLEIRRVMIERYGLSRYVVDSGAALIHEDASGRLYRKEFEDDEPLLMVQVINSTPEPDGSFKEYFLRVPPTIRTAKEAVAWTFGMTTERYHPQEES